MPWLLLLALLTGCPNPCEEVGPPLDYDDDAHWICRPGRDDLCAEPLQTVTIDASGSATTAASVPSTDPPVDCFYVYPTVDLRLRMALHDDLSDLDDPEDTVQAQFARFHEVCATYAPVYRQVTLGTYFRRSERNQPCFDVAYDDVLAAFDHYLAHDNDGRGIVLVGHSQGAQHVSRLIRDRFDGDPVLRDQLVIALPIGWSLGTDASAPTGGSFEQVPVCTTASEYGCALGFRSYGEGNPFPDVGGHLEGEVQVCTNPASPEDAAQTGRLSGTSFRADNLFIRPPEGVSSDADTWISWSDQFTARCVTDEGGHGALQLAWDGAGPSPVDLGSAALAGSSGTHVLDVGFTQMDLVESVQVRTAAWVER